MDWNFKEFSVLKFGEFMIVEDSNFFYVMFLEV